MPEFDCRPRISQLVIEIHFGFVDDGAASGDHIKTVQMSALMDGI